MTLSHDLQRTAAQVLTGLLDHDHLPNVTWHLRNPGTSTHIYTSLSTDFEMLSGQADSNQAVRDWATHLGTHVELRFADTPDAHAVVDGIVVRVWCAPAYRDDLGAGEKA
ncbi:hypothetical protein [Nocardiopsis sp. MG754419]|uniref:hypothetical protein n=1 Tax=Nocardiopsis sp. MG754419 TaxID=2259865 RepID=UPI001BAD2172|nr:hypothetical protein [Nocardiopsis sp. MG754419]